MKLGRKITIIFIVILAFITGTIVSSPEAIAANQFLEDILNIVTGNSAKLDSIEGTVGTIDGRFDSVEERLDNIETKLNDIEAILNPPEPSCGDGIIQQGEQCDDGNTSNGDGCSDTCQSENAVCTFGDMDSCSTACGTIGSKTCNETGNYDMCIPPAETCNGVDDDCNGTADEGFSCVQGSTGSCTTSCGTTGTRTCNGSCSWNSCIPPAEVLNGIDDNCDGQIDEGF